jgi:hypothetical protein
MVHSLRIDSADMPHAFAVTWRADAHLWRVIAAIVSLVAWYSAGMALLFRFLTDPVLGLFILALPVLPPVPRIDVCASPSNLSVTGMYDARIHAEDAGRASARQYGATPAGTCTCARHRA